MRAFLSALVVGPDAKPDEQALLSIVATLVFLGLIVYSVVWLGHEFDGEKFAICVAGLGVHRAASAWGNSKEQQ